MHRIILIIATALGLVACSDKSLNVIPYPNEVEFGLGKFTIEGAVVYCPESVGELAYLPVENFARELGLELVSERSIGKKISIEYDAELAQEAYRIEVRRRAVRVAAGSYNGFLYAMTTLREMLVDEGELSLPCVSIKDAPRFSYRAMHLDVARHFYGVKEVKKYLDMMAMHKMNYFHWHLTDDQGWRIEIKGFPRLTEIGSKRAGTVINKQWTSNDGVTHEGYYTQKEIREVVQYAAAKGITIIPEIDLPGHFLAALAAYPQYGCSGGPYEVWQRWGISRDVLCVGKEETMVFLEQILAQLADLFPGEFFHIGGDECPKTSWENCPTCQAKIAELGIVAKDGYSAEHHLQSYVMTRMQKLLESKGKRIIGWDEMLEGSPSEDAVIMSWRGTQGGIEASAAGHDVIMVPCDKLYLDYYQSEWQAGEPFAIGGCLRLEDVYAYEPYDPAMDEAARDRVLGVQANLWTEYIAKWDRAEYMLLPRQAAVSEIQWCKPEVRSWERFMKAMPIEMARYEELGYNYARTVYEVRAEVVAGGAEDRRFGAKGRKVSVSLSTVDGAGILYSLDGSDPSIRYTKALEINGACVLRARREAVLPESIESGCRELRREFVDNKAMGCKIEITGSPAENRIVYDNGRNVLVDGILGFAQHDSGQWAAWEGSDCSFVVDMGRVTEIAGLRIGWLSGKDEDIFPPTWVEVSVSEDGLDYTVVDSASYELEGIDAPHGRVESRFDFIARDARFVRIKAHTACTLPSWHARAGGKTYIYADELIVE